MIRELFGILSVCFMMGQLAQAAQSSYVARSIPGPVNVYEFDTGGEGVSYHDISSGNSGNANYRTNENVDVYSRGSGNLEVDAATGEWLEFTVNAASTANYSFAISYSDTVDGSVSLSADGGTAVLADLPKTGGNGTFKSANFKNSLSLKAGSHVLRLTVVSGSPNLRRISSSAQTENAWILANFSNITTKTGNYTSRQNVEAPVLVKDSTGTNAKYAFAGVDAKAPYDNRFAYVNVTIKDLKSTDTFGAGIYTSSSYPGATVYLSNVYIEPNWPTWIDYSKTNYDGMTFDSAAAVYGENVTVKNWNADGGLDSKAVVNQFVNLQILGSGHRSMRIWGKGPHYFVNSSINNDSGGTLVWIRDCSTVVINVYNTKFAGSSTIPASRLQCDAGSNPKINYLTVDPRKTGEMHAMFD